MAHKTLIGGTEYQITGGKTLVNGTVYDIKKGRTLVGGTGYDINFFRLIAVSHRDVNHPSYAIWFTFHLPGSGGEAGEQFFWEEDGKPDDDVRLYLYERVEGEDRWDFYKNRTPLEAKFLNGYASTSSHYGRYNASGYDEDILAKNIIFFAEIVNLDYVVNDYIHIDYEG